MKLKHHGIGTLKPEITHISNHGIWILLDDREYMLGFNEFPWFKDATIAQIQNVEVKRSGHVYWPDLDIDLDKNRMEEPEKYPLVAKKRG
jgi:hypothetical protein